MDGQESAPCRIIAVDDEEVILKLYRQIFAENNRDRGNRIFDLTLCTNAEEAVAAFEGAAADKHPYAVVFLDIYMPPGRSGIWAAEKIRRMDPHVNIVFVTGYTGHDLKEISRRIAPPDKLLYLQKPFHIQEIWQFASALSAKWEAENEIEQAQIGLEALVERRTRELVETNRQLKQEVKHRVVAEDRMRASERKFRTMIANNADGIMVLDKAGCVRFMNPSAEKLFGKNADDLIGKPFGFPAVTDETTEIDIISTESRPITLEMRVVETEWEGKLAFLASLRDITERRQMAEELARSLKRLELTMRDTVRATAQIVENRDPYTAGHQRRVADIAKAISQAMGFADRQIEGIYLASVIHDVGKISIPAEILSKPGRLTDIEFALMKTHAQIGFDILKDIKFAWPIAEIVYQHHERIDGSGYPRALKKDDILMEARIMSVADVVEAMASHRPYRPALGIETALGEIETNRGRLYDPDVVDVCLNLFRKKGFRLPEVA